jgi:hypothetical protein
VVLGMNLTDRPDYVAQRPAQVWRVEDLAVVLLWSLADKGPTGARAANGSTAALCGALNAVCVIW